MKNLEQIRAAHALKFWERELKSDLGGDNDGNVISGLPSLIINNGLLATLAFAKSKKGGHETFANEIGRFLASTGEDGRKLLDPKAGSMDGLITVLSSSDSQVLQQATAETLAYLGYLKRFQIKKS